MVSRVLLVAARPWITMARLARMLVQAGAHVTIMAPEGSVLRNRYAQAAVPCASVPERLDGELRAHLATAPAYQRIVLCDERVLRMAAGWTAPACPGWPGWVEGNDVSRIGWMTRLSRAGVAVVPSRAVEDRVEAREAASAWAWPLAIKKNWSAGGHGVRRLDAEADLEAAGRELEFPCLLQPWREGEQGTCEVMAARGRVLAWYASRTRDPWPEPFGPSSTRELFHDEALRPLVEAVAAATAFDGPCGFDWIRDERGYHVIEFNARPTTCYHIGPLVGVDFVRALRAWLEGRSDRQDPRPPRGGRAVVRVFPRYLMRAMARRSGRDLVRCLPGLERQDLPWSDPVLLARQTARALVDGWRAGLSGARTYGPRDG